MKKGHALGMAQMDRSYQDEDDHRTMTRAAEIQLDLPGEETLHLTAEVVRVETEPRPGMALRFVEGERGRRGLANFIMRQHATTR